MIYSYCLDNEKRLVSICGDDLSGCSDWYRGDIDLTPADDITDDRGAALYKLENGKLIERSLEERMEDWPAPEENDEATIDDFAAALQRLGVMS